MDIFTLYHPIFAVSRAVGLAPFEILQHLDQKILVKSQKFFYYSVSLLLFSVIVLIRELLEEGWEEMRSIREPLWTSARVLSLIVFFTCSLEMCSSVTLKSSHILKAFNLIKKIELKNNSEEKRFVRNFVMLNLSSFALCLVHGVVVNVVFFKADATRMLQVAFYFGFLFLMNVYASQFVILVFFMSSAYNRLNEMLIHTSKNEFVQPVLLQKFKKARERDLVLKDFLCIVFLAYMQFIFFYISYIFLILIHGAMYIIQDEFSFINLIIWVFYYCTQICNILVACSYTSFQAEKTANYLHELFIDNDDPELKEEIEIFSLQLLHRKVEFNACGFFKLDFSLLYSMVGAVTTYIIILMQFQGNHGPGPGNCVANCTSCVTV